MLKPGSCLPFSPSSHPVCPGECYPIHFVCFLSFFALLSLSFLSFCPLVSRPIHCLPSGTNKNKSTIQGNEAKESESSPFCLFAVNSLHEGAVRVLFCLSLFTAAGVHPAHPIQGHAYSGLVGRFDKGENVCFLITDDAFSD